MEPEPMQQQSQRAAFFLRRPFGKAIAISFNAKTENFISLNNRILSKVQEVFKIASIDQIHLLQGKPLEEWFQNEDFASVIKQIKEHNIIHVIDRNKLLINSNRQINLYFTRLDLIYVSQKSLPQNQQKELVNSVTSSDIQRKLVKPSMKIHQFISQLAFGVSPDDLFLSYAGKKLDRQKTFKQQFVQNNSYVYCMHRDMRKSGKKNRLSHNQSPKSSANLKLVSNNIKIQPPQQPRKQTLQVLAVKPQPKTDKVQQLKGSCQLSQADNKVYHYEQSIIQIQFNEQSVQYGENVKFQTRQVYPLSPEKRKMTGETTYVQTPSKQICMETQKMKNIEKKPHRLAPNIANKIQQSLQEESPILPPGFMMKKSKDNKCSQLPVNKPKKIEISSHSAENAGQHRFPNSQGPRRNLSTFSIKREQSKNSDSLIDFEAQVMGHKTQSEKRPSAHKNDEIHRMQTRLTTSYIIEGNESENSQQNSPEESLIIWKDDSTTHIKSIESETHQINSNVPIIKSEVIIRKASERTKNGAADVQIQVQTLQGTKQDSKNESIIQDYNHFFKNAQRCDSNECGLNAHQQKNQQNGTYHSEGSSSNRQQIDLLS